MGPGGGGGGGMVSSSHRWRRQRSVSSLPQQLFPRTLVEPSQGLHHRKLRAPDVAPKAAEREESILT
jgi:hypothetical protein